MNALGGSFLGTVQSIYMGTVKYWPISTAVFVLVGAVAALFFNRGLSRRSAGAILGYVFRRDLYGHRTSRVDILHTVLTVGLWKPITGAVVAVLLSFSVRNLLAGQFGGRAALLHDPWVIISLQFLALYVSRSFGAYVGHYMLHRVPLLWSFHRAHHSAEALTIFAKQRSHPLEDIFLPLVWSVFGALGLGTLLYLTGTGMSAQAVAAVAFLDAATSYTTDLFAHCHFPISFGRLNYVWMAPIMHQIHHSAEPRHRDKNLGGDLMIFDWMFGTLYVPKGHEDYRWGLNETEIGQGNPHLRLRDFYLEPLKYARQILKTGGRGVWTFSGS